MTMAGTDSPVVLTPEQEKRALTRLRFPAEIECDFRREYEASAPVSRMTLQVLSILLITLTPLYDTSLLRAPAEFIPHSRLIEFGVAIPLLLLALLTTAVPRLRRLSAHTTLFVAIGVSGCFTVERLIGQSIGFEVPRDFSAMTFVAVFFLGHMRLAYVLPWALLTLTGTTIFEISMVHDSGAIYGMISNWMLFTIAATGAFTLEYSARQSWYRGRLLKFQAAHDALTGLINRRQFDLQLRELVRDAVRQRKNVALMIMDIDHFKAFNDHYGHPAGDECLRRVGARLKLAMRRPRDFAARIGGEEFAAAWFDATPHDAMRLAEELRRSVEGLGLSPPPGFGVSVTSSAGFVQTRAPSPADTVERISADLMKTADAALYEAKRSGRARTVFAGMPTPQGLRSKIPDPALARLC